MKARIDLVPWYRGMFVNRLAYTVQTGRPDPETGRHFYYRPTDRKTGRGVSLTSATIQKHLHGDVTIGLFAINPKTQRSKWIVVDADNAEALSDLRRLQAALRDDGIETGLEMSRRGGHLWIFMATPLLARDCRIYAYNFVMNLGLPIKGPRNTNGVEKCFCRAAEGVEIFPKQDEVPDTGFGNAVRGPLGVHRAVAKRFWFEGAKPDCDSQMRYLAGLPRVTEDQLRKLIAGKTMPAQFERKSVVALTSHRFSNGGNVFQILGHVAGPRRVGKEWVTQCPSCAAAGGDRARDNLHINVANPLVYCCRAGCSSDMIRAALGHPRRRLA